jgi:hypothetical protein
MFTKTGGNSPKKTERNKQTTDKTKNTKLDFKLLSNNLFDAQAKYEKELYKGNVKNKPSLPIVTEINEIRSQMQNARTSEISLSSKAKSTQSTKDTKFKASEHDATHKKHQGNMELSTQFDIIKRQLQGKKAKNMSARNKNLSQHSL